MHYIICIMRFWCVNFNMFCEINHSNDNDNNDDDVVEKNIIEPMTTTTTHIMYNTNQSVETMSSSS